MRSLWIIAALFFTAAAYGKELKLVTSEPLNSQHEILPAKGRNGILIHQKLTFGDYHTVFVKRSGIRRWSSGTGFTDMIWTEHSEGKQKIHFRLTNGTDTSDVLALSRVSSDDLVIGSNPNSLPNTLSSILRIGTEDQKNNFSVAIYTTPSEKPWQLFLDNTHAELHRASYLGFVERDDKYYTIVPVWKVERKGKVSSLPFGCVGFEIRNEKGDALAAVSLLNNGAVYMGQSDSKERFLMANICAALLLQANIAE